MVEDEEIEGNHPTPRTPPPMHRDDDHSSEDLSPPPEIDVEESDINDAILLRSMLQDSEEYYENAIAEQEQEEKHCWVCFALEEDDLTAVWVHPCKCVHYFINI